MFKRAGEKVEASLSAIRAAKSLVRHAHATEHGHLDHHAAETVLALASQELEKTTATMDEGARAEQLRHVWTTVDTDGDGTLSPDEVRTLLRRMHLTDGDRSVERALKQLDADANGEIDFNEFLAVHSQLGGNARALSGGGA